MKKLNRDCLAEWSKALASGASPKGRGFESLSSHFFDDAQKLLGSDAKNDKLTSKKRIIIIKI